MLHVSGSTYGTWLHGDRRGWRSRNRRDNAIGDYKNPPPEGMYERLEQYSRNMLKKDPVLLDLPQRRITCRAMAEKLIATGSEVLAICVGREHYHILAKFPDARIRHWIGLAKKHSSFILSEYGICGQVWARKCHV